MKLHVLIAGSSFPRLCSAVTLLRSEGRSILVDSGLCSDRPKLLAALEGQQLTPSDIDVIVTTHLHYDHCGNHMLFPSARWVVGTRELKALQAFMAIFHADNTPNKKATSAYLRRQNQTIKPFHVRSIVREVNNNIDFYDRVLQGDERFIALDQPTWLSSEIEVILTPGHTVGHLSVVAHQVRLDRHHPAVEVLVAGDAVSSPAAAFDSEPKDPHMAADVELSETTRCALLDRYRYIVPGHGNLLDTHGSAPPERKIA